MKDKAYQMNLHNWRTPVELERACFDMPYWEVPSREQEKAAKHEDMGPFEESNKNEGKFENTEERIKQERSSGYDRMWKKDNGLQKLIQSLGGVNGIISMLGGATGGLDIGSILEKLNTNSETDTKTANNGGFNWMSLLPLLLSSGIFSNRKQPSNVGNTINLDSYRRID